MQKYILILLSLFCMQVSLAEQTAVVPAEQQPQYQLTATSKEPLSAGQEAHITLSLKDPAGKPVTADMLKLAHTKKVHALIIDPTLTDYHHEHPQPGSKPGEYLFTFTPQTDNNYRIWLDIVPNAGEQQYVITDLSGKNQTNPPVKKIVSQDAQVDNYQFALTFDPKALKVNQAAMGSIVIKDKAGQPFKQLEPVMGAFAHIVAFSEDYRTILHVHPMGAEPTDPQQRGGPQVDFHVTPTMPGYVKIFGQVQINNEQVFAPFGVEVEQ